MTPRSDKYPVTAGWARPAYGAADLLGNIGMALRETLDVGLVDHRLFEGNAKVRVAFPVEGALGDHALGHGRCGVEVIEPFRIVQIVSEHRLAPRDLPVDGRRVGVEQELGGIAPQPVPRIPGTLHPQAVALARPDIRQEAVPDMGRSLRQRDPLLGSVPIKEAELDGAGHFGRHRDIETLSCGRGAQGKGTAGR